MTARALVLGGGGVAGIAWQTGILLGIADESPRAARALLDSDMLLGTSAGSAVVAQIDGGSSLAELFDMQIAESSAEIECSPTTSRWQHSDPIRWILAAVRRVRKPGADRAGRRRQRFRRF